MRTYRVIVADDDPTFRSAAVEVLEADDRFAVVGEVATGAGLVELVEETDADVVLLDVRMPGGGPAAAQQLTDRFGRRVVMVAVSAQVETASLPDAARAPPATHPRAGSAPRRRTSSPAAPTASWCSRCRPARPRCTSSSGP